ncbi:hypothetical protein PHMEG_00035587 [Phytophthora megakarya]|uniref:Uncharacterized protein n=1 Tax=Phytophthora megakarya TaxID=4795 RepID=A0A225UNW9_9STRA|nr:hypothetical protein PHMEG_00035587 [Phytophthora megakarya]
MTPSMMAARNALPLSNAATLMHIHEKTVNTSETQTTNVISSHEPRVSTGAKLSRKMKDLFSSKERRVESEIPEKKSAFYRQFIESRALVNKSLHSHLIHSKMNAHTRFALPVNTHGNLKYLHDKPQSNAACTSTADLRMHYFDSSTRLVERQKMKMLFPSKKAENETSPEDETTLNERKRSTTAQLVGSHAFVEMGRR